MGSLTGGVSGNLSLLVWIQMLVRSKRSELEDSSLPPWSLVELKINPWTPQMDAWAFPVSLSNRAPGNRGRSCDSASAQRFTSNSNTPPRRLSDSQLVQPSADCAVADPWICHTVNNRLDETTQSSCLGENYEWYTTVQYNSLFFCLFPHIFI